MSAVSPVADSMAARPTAGSISSGKEPPRIARSIRIRMAAGVRRSHSSYGTGGWSFHTQLSSAWHMAHRAFEEGRLRAAAEEC